MSKPSWVDRPEWANWRAMDSDGEWWWFENEPKQLTFAWGMQGGRVEFAGCGNDWTETLEYRP